MTLNATAQALLEPTYALPDLPMRPSDVAALCRSSRTSDEFTASIRHAIETVACDEAYPTVRETARFVHMSVRTLQRRLAAAGVSHDVLVAESRFATAADLLAQSDAKILDL